MELKSLGTFRMGSGRPIDSIRFEKMNTKCITFQTIGAGELAMPVQSIVKINQDPHPDYFKSLDALVPFAVEILDLGARWKTASSIGSLKLEWCYSNVTERFTYKIDSITIVRSSDVGEIPIQRSVSFGKITGEDIPYMVRDAIEQIMDEAWLYTQGAKTAQLNLFDIPEINAHSIPEGEYEPAEIEAGKIKKATRSKARKGAAC